jgi:transposase
VLEPDASGIDIGAESIYVAVPPDRAAKSTRRFSSFTSDLHALADWLCQCRIQSVAMESTGVYWIPLFQFFLDPYSLRCALQSPFRVSPGHGSA